MGTDTIDVEVGETRLRIISRAPELTDQLRAALVDQLVDEECEPGFVVDHAATHGALFTLVDRTGFILARSRTVGGCRSAVLSHLAALLPPPDGTIPARMRALIRDGQAVLAAFPLLTTPPVIERRLQRTGWGLVDRMIVTLTPESDLHLARTPWSMTSDRDIALGHALEPDGPIEVARVLIPGGPGLQPSEAGVVAFLAALFDGSSSRDVRLDVAERLASRASTVATDDAGALYAALP